MKQSCFYMLDAVMLLCISLPSWPNINTLCNTVDRERFLSLEYITESKNLATCGIGDVAQIWV